MPAPARGGRYSSRCAGSSTGWTGRFNRRRYEAARTVPALRPLREQVDLDALLTELLAVVEQTMQPTQASLWLRRPANPGLR
jgi:hypothetical protein